MQMNKKELEAFAKEAVKGIKTPDLSTPKTCKIRRCRRFKAPRNTKSTSQKPH